MSPLRSILELVQGASFISWLPSFYMSSESMVSTTILEHCHVAPAADGDLPEQTLPLTFFDILWVHYHPIQRLLFYQFSGSNTHFLQTIVPQLKNSLSQTLKHFLPLAGHLIVPLNPELLPQIRYVPGDSVSVMVAESSEAHDFNYLTGNHPRVADEFYAFFPDLPPSKTNSGFKKIPVLAVQITLFPGAGICIGITNNHTVGDASSIVGFIKAWCSVAKLGGDDDHLSATQLLPFYDRSVVKDPSGRLINLYWNQMKHFKIDTSPLNFPTNKVRATYILQKKDIHKLRNYVQAKKPALDHLSSFTITAAYVWSCLAKSAGEEVDGHEPEYFAFAVNVRQRTDPPIPAAYFGNCIALALTETTHSELKGDEGFVIAVKLIGDVISKKVNNKDEILADADQWLSKFGYLIGKRLFGVAGSPKFDLYSADFGWGKPEKYEAVSIDGDGSMSLSKSRKFEGGLEISLSLSNQKMDAFAALFSLGLEVLY